MNPADCRFRHWRTLTGYGEPPAIFSELAEATPAVSPSVSRLTRLFPVALNRGPGAAVGRFVLGLGHHRIAYITPYHSATWSRDRLTGLREVFDTVVGCGRAPRLYNKNNRDERE